MPLDRPIPAFYCCYLLRSTVRHARVYIGSTPNPARRLGQHNGLTKGGAARTNRDNLRPWQMTCIVTGFPSQIAALQFEWAWQNPHVTLHIPPKARIQHATQKKRSGQPKRPQHTISSLLSNLHLLLRVPSFARWPLDLRFFDEDVYRAWIKVTKTVEEPLRDSISIITDFTPANSATTNDSDGNPGSKSRNINHRIAALNVDYAKEKEHVKKAKEIIDFEREGACSVCQKGLEHDAGFYTICPNPGCETVTHVTCLGKHFLKDDKESLIPINGTCPSCKAELRWVDVVKELSLRMRGQKEVINLLKSKRIQKRKPTASQSVLESEGDEDDEVIKEDIYEEIKRRRELHSAVSKTDIGDRWHVIDNSEDSDASSVASTASQSKKAVSGSSNADKTGTLATVIEDSDWDDALVLD